MALVGHDKEKTHDEYAAGGALIIDGYEEGSESRRRWRIVEKDKAFDFIRHKLVAETRAEDFLAALQAGTVSTNVYLRRVQNYALGMNWLIVPIIPKKLFPAVRHKARRAITQFEHERIPNATPWPRSATTRRLCIALTRNARLSRCQVWRSTNYGRGKRVLLRNSKQPWPTQFLD
jgi:hypothetical protein